MRCEALGTAAFEWKLDGARVQVHKAGDDVRIFTRSRNDVTASAPEIVAAVRASPVPELILDGEAIALQANGAPQPFQVTMRRFGRTLDVPAMQASLPLSVFFFDCLRFGADALTDAAATERVDALSRALPRELLIPRLVTGDAAEAESVLRRRATPRTRRRDGEIAERALRSGQARARHGSRSSGCTRSISSCSPRSGAMAGARASCPTCISAARDEASGGFVMLGKTFKGMTDEMLAWQTTALLARETGRDAMTVHVRPELVVEIAFNDLQASPHYPGGLALRFARVKRYRGDKRRRMPTRSKPCARSIRVSSTAGALGRREPAGA